MENKEKISYEQLNDYCNQLMMQNRQLSQRLNQVMNIHTKLPFLFEVLKSERFFEMEFVDKCAKEIETILNPMESSPDETMGEEEKEEEKEED